MANDTPDALVAATLAVAVQGEDQAVRRRDADRLFNDYRYLLAKMREVAAAEAQESTDAWLAGMRKDS